MHVYVQSDDMHVCVVCSCNCRTFLIVLWYPSAGGSTGTEPHWWRLNRKSEVIIDFMEILTGLSTSHPQSGPRVCSIKHSHDPPCAHTHTHTHTHTLTDMITLSSLSCTVAMALHGRDFDCNQPLHRFKTKNHHDNQWRYISERRRLCSSFQRSSK